MSEADVSEWPGTLLQDGTEHLYCFSLTDQAIEVVCRHADGLYDWINPQLPEDMHLLRNDGSVLLGSTAIEEYSWMQLSEAEFYALTQAIPWVRGHLVPRKIE